MIEVNGKMYPLWSQFVENKSKWVGGILQDLEKAMYSGKDRGTMETIITNIELIPNGDKNAFFSVKGKDFSCGFDVEFGGISSRGEKGWLTFLGYMGHEWRIKEKG